MLKLNREIGADKVGLDAVALNGTRTGNLIQLSGYDQISIMVTFASRRPQSVPAL